MRFDKSDEPAASVIICGYRSLQRIDRALASLRQQDLEEPFEVIAVLSGNDGCDRHIRTAHSDVRVVSSKERLFPGRARNAGVRVASSPVLAFLPDDGYAASEWLRVRLKHHRAGYPLVGGAITNGTRRSIVGTACYYVEYAASIPVKKLLEKQPIPHTLSYSASVFEQLGWFPELDVPGEDTLFNRRCVLAGLPVAFEPRAAIAHDNLRRLTPYLEHQREHGRGLARCVRSGGLAGPFDLGGPIVLAQSALLRYPLTRWGRTLGLLATSAPSQLFPYFLLTPWVLAGYLAGGLGSWEELVDSGDPSPSVQ